MNQGEVTRTGEREAAANGTGEALRKLLLDVNSAEFGYFGNAGGQPEADGNTSFRLGPITFDIYQGEFLAIIGPNGSGKSTLLRILAGLSAPQRGSVMLKGREVSALEPRRRARRIAVLRQQPSPVFSYTAEQFVLLGRYPFRDGFGFENEADQRAAKAAMEATQTCSLAGRLTEEISGGEMQRVVLARALAQEPELLLLDEPTANLDLAFQVELLRMIRRLMYERGLGVAAVMHEVNLASQFADYILLLRKGRLFRFGTPDDVLTAGALEEAYGMPMRVDWCPETGRPRVTVLATRDL
jgi:iron complex transport system ATP-binding protein